MLNPNQIINNFSSSSSMPKDGMERLRSLDISKSFLVEAPAGSGKTELLTQRYLAALSVCAMPEEVLAITFTNKGVSEMRSRVVGALMFADESPEPNDDHLKLTWHLAKNVLVNSDNRGWNILDDINRLQIKTFDALYGSIVQSSPEIGVVGSGMKITDDAKRCYLSAARDLLLTLEQDCDWSDSIEAVLTHVDNRVDYAEQLLVSLLEKREHWLPLVLDSSDSEDLRTKMEDTLKEVAVSVISKNEALLNKYLDDASSLIGFAIKTIDFEKNPEFLPLAEFTGFDVKGNSPEAWCALSHFLLTKDGKLRKSATAAIGFPAPSKANDPNDKVIFSSMKSNFKSLVESLQNDDEAIGALQQLRFLPPESYADKDWDILKHLMRLLPVLAAKLLVAFKRNKVVDHVQMAASAMQVLGTSESPGDVALLLDTQLRHVLIDEFQDTNNLQLRSINMLTTGWERDDGRSIFLVGDPMQSIYAFRGSNVGLFLDVAKNGIGSLQIERARLTVNFRSQENIVNWVNETFSSVFPDKEDADLGAIPHSKADPFHAPNSLMSDVSIIGFKGDQITSRESEGHWLAKKVESVRDKYPENSIGILVRNRTHLESTIRNLQSLNIPFQAVDIAPLKTRSVIRDLSIITRCLCSLSDRTAWLALLKSPVCGLSHKDLEVVASTSSRTLIWDNISNSDIINSISKSGLKRITNVKNIFVKSFGLIDRKPLASVVRGLWLGLYGAGFIKESADKSNVDSFFNVIGKLSHVTFDVERFNDEMDRLYAKPQSSTDNPVQVMTVHRSKGLQFDHVFIPGCDRGSRPDGSQLLVWDRFTNNNGTEKPLLAASGEFGGEKNQLCAFLSQQSAQRTALERDRILYVGCTRAKQELYITFSADIDDNGDIKPPSARSFAGSLWPYVQSSVDFKDADETITRDYNEQIVNPDEITKAKDGNESPTFKRPQTLKDYRGFASTENNNVDISWGVDYSSKIGDVFHMILEQICLTDVNTWDDEKIRYFYSAWRKQMESAGIPDYVITTSLRDIVRKLNLIISSEDGKWILDNSHTDSACEFPLSFTVNGKSKSIVIDRTFSEGNTRWIIDYKTTSKRTEETMKSFHDRVISEHKNQLSKYKDVVSAFEDKDIRCAIYLTDTQSFLEVDLGRGSVAA